MTASSTARRRAVPVVFAPFRGPCLSQIPVLASKPAYVESAPLASLSSSSLSLSSTFSLLFRIGVFAKIPVLNITVPDYSDQVIRSTICDDFLHEHVHYAQSTVCRVETRRSQDFQQLATGVCGLGLFPALKKSGTSVEGSTTDDQRRCSRRDVRAALPGLGDEERDERQPATSLNDKGID